MARNLKKILTGSLAVNGHNPLNEVKKGVDQKGAHRSATTTVAAGNQCDRSALPSTALCVRVFKTPRLPPRGVPGKRKQERFDLEQELGHILTA